MPKYTDEQIKKALECCINWEATTCEKCPLDDECDNDGDTPLRNALDLINRQKAEIERLESLCEKIGIANDVKLERICVLQEDLETAKAEAIKEFAERLKKSAFDCDVSFGFGREHYTEAVTVFEIDNLVKEMVGENNA